MANFAGGACRPAGRGRLCRKRRDAGRDYLKPMIEIETASRPRRDVVQAMRRGFAQRCPACGRGRLFRTYLKTADACPACGEALHHHRTDDAPPYFTIVVVGHLIVGGVLALEKAAAPPTWLHLALWLPLTLVACLWLLPRIKGALVGLQWALYMHGFEPGQEAPAAHAAGPQPPV
jgi:uncharacterized protein (DUF983 family)